MAASTGARKAPPGAPTNATPTPNKQNTPNVQGAAGLVKKEKAANSLKERERASRESGTGTAASAVKPTLKSSVSKSSAFKFATSNPNGLSPSVTAKPKKPTTTTKMAPKLKLRGPNAPLRRRERRPAAKGAWKEGAQDRDTSIEGTPTVERRNSTTNGALPGDTPKAGRPAEDERADADPAKADKDDRKDETNTIYCKHCKRSVGREESAEHIRSCVAKKQEKQRRKKEAKEAKDLALRRERGEDVDEAAERRGGKGAVVDGDGAKKGKKRKAGDAEGGQGPNKKKKKDEIKAKAKPKGPVDVERQCGVRLPNGGFCARSLTCKSHSMGLKRAVGGRSLPYDMLLAQYQKKNQAKQQRAAIDAHAPLPDDIEPAGPVDSDEETELIMSALSRHAPRPMATFHPVSQRAKYQQIRMRDILRSALGGSVFGSGGMNAGGGMNTGGMNAGGPNGPNGLGADARSGLSLSIMGAPNSVMGQGQGQNPNSAVSETFPSSAGGTGSASASAGAGVDTPMGGMGGMSGMGMNMNPGSRRQSSISMGAAGGGPRQILPGQLPGPGPQGQGRKSSVASVGSMGP